MKESKQRINLQKKKQNKNKFFFFWKKDAWKKEKTESHWRATNIWNKFHLLLLFSRFSFVYVFFFLSETRCILFDNIFFIIIIVLIIIIGLVMLLGEHIVPVNYVYSEYLMLLFIFNYLSGYDYVFSCAPPYNNVTKNKHIHTNRSQWITVSRWSMAALVNRQMSQLKFGRNNIWRKSNYNIEMVTVQINSKHNLCF